MAVGKDFEAFAVDLFSPLGPLRVKRMFGAAMVYRGDLGFALLNGEAIWIKVDELVEPIFAAEDCGRFIFPMKDGRVMELAYRQLPLDAFDDSEEACRWAQLGLDAAMRKGAKVVSHKPKRRR